MKKLFLTVALCIGTAACVGVKAQDEVVMAETELKNEVIEMPEIGVKIVWDAGNEKLFILGSNRADVRSLSLDGECSVAKPDTGVRILYETTFGAAMPLYEQMRPKLSDDELGLWPAYRFISGKSCLMFIGWTKRERLFSFPKTGCVHVKC